MEERIISVGTVRNIIKENMTPTLPKDTKKALSGNKAINNQHLKELEKEMKGAYKVEDKPVIKHEGLSYESDPDSANFNPNKGMLNVMTGDEASEEYKERVKKDVCGSDDSEGDNSGNKKYYELQQKKNKEYEKYNKSAVEKMPARFSEEHPVTESASYKRLRFKNTKFNSDEEVKKFIPESYKVEGNKFIMEDMNGLQFIYECKKIGLGELSMNECYLIEKRDKKAISNEMARINEMFNYSPANTIKGSKGDKRETINEMMSCVRKMIL